MPHFKEIGAKIQKPANPQNPLSYGALPVVHSGSSKDL